MVILGIETSCDETAAAILQKKGNEIRILSNIIASSAKLQSKYGGIIPEQAAREQIKSIIPVIEEAILAARLSGNQTIKRNSTAASMDSAIAKIDAIAVTLGPGLIGSLLVGVETAKVLSLIWQKPIIPINHLIGHFYANWIIEASKDGGKRSTPSRPHRDGLEARRLDGAVSLQDPEKPAILPVFPCIGLLVSGGHTDLVHFKNHSNYQYLGGTRDDAAGECFDKCARLLGQSYPGGPEISRLAKKGDPKKFNLPRPMIDSDDFDFSYSGLKTAVANLISSGWRLPPNAMSPGLDEGERIRGLQKPQDARVGKQDSWVADRIILNDLCASIESAIVDPLIKKTLKATQQFNIKTIILGGGVAANEKLRSEFEKALHLTPYDLRLIVPPPHLCTDNAAMIASAAFFSQPANNPLDIQATPNLLLSQ